MPLQEDEHQANASSRPTLGNTVSTSSRADSNAVLGADKVQRVKKVAQLTNASLSSLTERRLPLVSYMGFKVGKINRLAEMLSGYSVDDVKALITDIENGREATHYHSTENTIHNVIFNQPHSTDHFAEYYSPKRKPIRRRHYAGSIMGYIAAVLASFLIGFFVSILDVNMLLNNDLTVMLVTGSVLSVISCTYIAFAQLESMTKKGEDFGYALYGNHRHGITLYRYEELLFENAQKKRDRELQRLKKQASTLNKSLTSFGARTQIVTSSYDYEPRQASSQPTVPDMSEVKADYQSALSTITSYELDIMKAVKYPAFNDITVSDVRDMHLLLKESRQAISSDDAISARERVNELMLAVKVAERTAQRIAWSDMSERERKDLTLAQNLIVQVENEGNTTEMRAVLYQRLRKVIERLNSQHSIVPKQTILLVEERSRKELTQG